jgi:hypothetical protein
MKGRLALKPIMFLVTLGLLMSVLFCQPARGETPEPTTTGNLINVVFYIVLFGMSVVFSLLSLGFNPKSVPPEQRWKGVVYAALAMVFWLTLGIAHVSVVAIFSSTYLVGFSYLWMGLGFFFLIYAFYCVIQTIQLAHEQDEMTIK